MLFFHRQNARQKCLQVKIPAASGGALEGRSLSCWGNLSPKPPNKDAIPPHRKQWGILASFREVAAHFQEGLSLDVLRRGKQLNGWEVKWERGLLERGRSLQCLRVSLPLLLPCESELFNARHDLGKTFHRTLHSTSRMLM